MIDRPHEFAWPTLHVTGADAASWLQGILTADVSVVRPGVATVALLLSKVGKIQAELQVMGQSDSLFLGLSGGDAEETLRTLDSYLVMEDAEIQIVEGARWVVAGKLDAGAQANLERSGVRSAPLPWAPSFGTLSFAEQAEGRALDEWLEAAGQMDAAEWERARVLLGIPQYGVDFGPSDNPHQASLERRSVAWNKGCYLGQEVVCMQDMRGKVKRRLVRLEHPGSVLAPGTHLAAGPGDGGAPLADARVVGEVTSGTLGVSIARVEAPSYEPGANLVAQLVATGSTPGIGEPGLEPLGVRVAALAPP